MGRLPLRSDPLEQHTRRLVVRVLRHEFAAECLGENGLVQMIDQFAGGYRDKRSKVGLQPESLGATTNCK